MISGFNTDVKYDGTTYHVQTEDKGLASRLIVSLVYNGGTILASKRSPYDDLVNGDLNEQELAERLSRQHKLICAAVKAGRIDDLIKMQRRPERTAATAVEAIANAPERVAESAVIDEPASAQPSARSGSEDIHRTIADADIHTTQQVVTNDATGSIVAGISPASPLTEMQHIEKPVESVSPVDDSETFNQPEIEFVLDDLIIEDVEILDDDDILPSDAVAVVTDLSGQTRPTNQKLDIDLVGDQSFRGGDRRTITLMVCRGTERRVVADAQIVIKILGSAFRPIIFHSRSDQNGLAKVHLEIPKFKAGRAALFVRVISDGDEVEVRRAITAGA